MLTQELQTQNPLSRQSCKSIATRSTDIILSKRVYSNSLAQQHDSDRDPEEAKLGAETDLDRLANSPRPPHKAQSMRTQDTSEDTTRDNAPKEHSPKPNQGTISARASERHSSQSFKDHFVQWSARKVQPRPAAVLP
eukprot:gb/GEZN01011592.1/.p1 GENE.gb/GEZN01011592.1/~~gb/GEZN01011592.1/.p1  ORF type:complete len:137 (+),score=10.36 gb/GEZN01011592.1/:680-1090(+)